ncbi:MAG: Spy/CpxP family protein refolding chaperone [Hyphomicrobium sp.]|jgi:DNA repair ATPase RecN
MSKIVVSGLTALFFATSSLAHAQATDPAQQSTSEVRSVTNQRIDVVKFALQLTPEQTKFWPAIEEAIRARAEARQQRVENVVARIKSLREGQPERDPIKVLQERAEALSERGANLKKLADAWQPLYATLSDGQKLRMRILVASVLHEMSESIENRRLQLEEEDVGIRGAIGAGAGESGVGRE